MSDIYSREDHQQFDDHCREKRRKKVRTLLWKEDCNIFQVAVESHEKFNPPENYLTQLIFLRRNTTVADNSSKHHLIS